MLKTQLCFSTPTLSSSFSGFTEYLSGSQQYGTFVDDINASGTFSRSWKGKTYDEFLFSTSGFEKWMIVTRDSVGGRVGVTDTRHYADELRTIKKSSINNQPYQAKQYNRGGSNEDPWISLTDHGAGLILYGAGTVMH